LIGSFTFSIWEIICVTVSGRFITFNGYGLGHRWISLESGSVAECRTFRGIGRCRRNVLSIGSPRTYVNVMLGLGTSSGSLSATQSLIITLLLSNNLPRSCFSFSLYYFYSIRDFYSAFFLLDSFYCRNWQNFCKSFWSSLSFFFISYYFSLNDV
jgi:hypothetical protein